MKWGWFCFASLTALLGPWLSIGNGFAQGALAGSEDRSISLHAKVAAIPGLDGRLIVWQDQDVKIHLDLAYLQFPPDGAHTPVQGAPANPLVIAPRWWERVAFSLTFPDGNVRSVQPAPIQSGPGQVTGQAGTAGDPARKRELPINKSLAVDLTLGRLSVGDYVLTAIPLDKAAWRLLGSVEVSRPLHFVVREGTEDKATELMRYRERLDRATSDAEAKPLLERLAVLDPRDPQYYEQLGDLTLSSPSPETSAYYDRAIQAQEQRGTAHGSRFVEQGTGNDTAPHRTSRTDREDVT